MVHSELPTLSIPLVDERWMNWRVALYYDGAVQVHDETEQDVAALHQLRRSEWNLGWRALNTSCLAAELDANFLQEEGGLPSRLSFGMLTVFRSLILNTTLVSLERMECGGRVLGIGSNGGSRR